MAIARMSTLVWGGLLVGVYVTIVGFLMSLGATPPDYAIYVLWVGLSTITATVLITVAQAASRLVTAARGSSDGT